MPSREYFYKDDEGKTKKYIYCSMCQKGPFKEEQSDLYKKFYLGYPVFYCNSCSFVLNLGKPSETIQRMIENNPHDIPKQPSESLLKTNLVEIEPEIVCNTEPPKTVEIEEKIEKVEHVTEPAQYCLSNFKQEPAKKGFNGKSHVYVLEGSDNSLTSGIVKDLSKVMDYAYSGQVDKNRLPVEMVFYKTFRNNIEAERFLKNFRKRNSTAKNILIKNFEKEYLNRTY